MCYPGRLVVYAVLSLSVCSAITGCRSTSADIGRIHTVSEPRKIIPRRYDARRTATPIRIDGRLDDAAWQSAAWTERFVDIQGSVKPKARFQTRTKLMWDENALYIGAELEEPDVWATLTEHDAIVFRDNDFEVFIDPDGNGRSYFEIEVNALNTVFDLYLEKPYLEGGPAHHDWNALGLQSAVSIDGTLNDPADRDTGWTVEMAVPWQAFGDDANAPLPPPPGDIWRVNFSRVQWQHRVVNGQYVKVPHTPEDNWVWSPQGVIDMHLPWLWGYVTFMSQPSE